MEVFGEGCLEGGGGEVVDVDVEAAAGGVGEGRGEGCVRGGFGCWGWVEEGFSVGVAGAGRLGERWCEGMDGWEVYFTLRVVRGLRSLRGDRDRCRGRGLPFCYGFRICLLVKVLE